MPVPRRAFPLMVDGPQVPPDGPGTRSLLRALAIARGASPSVSPIDAAHDLSLRWVDGSHTTLQPAVAHFVHNVVAVGIAAAVGYSAAMSDCCATRRV